MIESEWKKTNVPAEKHSWKRTGEASLATKITLAEELIDVFGAMKGTGRTMLVGLSQNSLTLLIRLLDRYLIEDIAVEVALADNAKTRASSTVSGEPSDAKAEL